MHVAFIWSIVCAAKCSSKYSPTIPLVSVARDEIFAFHFHCALNALCVESYTRESEAKRSWNLVPLARDDDFTYIKLNRSDFILMSINSIFFPRLIYVPAYAWRFGLQCNSLLCVSCIDFCSAGKRWWFTHIKLNRSDSSWCHQTLSSFPDWSVGQLLHCDW